MSDRDPPPPHTTREVSPAPPAARDPRSARAGVTLAVAHLAVTAFMVGLIWYVQVVHYPLMAGWPAEDFPRYEAAHRERTGWIVVPVMLTEGLLAAALVVRRPRGVAVWLPAVGLMALVALQVSTFFIQVPCHERLAQGWDPATHAWLVESNWIRTAAWSFRGLLAASIVLRATC